MSIEALVVEDYSDEIKKLLDHAIEQGLEKCGLVAEGYAKRLCPVGTPESTGIEGYIGGTLRNSITHAMDGGSPAISEYKDNAGNIKGGYNGTLPSDSNGSRTVYIGTNVEYAPYVELGVSNNKVGPRPYLKPAIENHKSEYKKIIGDLLK